MKKATEGGDPKGEASRRRNPLWQGRRARGMAKGSNDNRVEPWQEYEFGNEHAPLAPPPSGGYITGGGGVAGAQYGTAERVLHLSAEERRFLDRLELRSTDPGALHILERLQRWDAQVAAIVSKSCRTKLRSGKRATRALEQLSMLSWESLPRTPRKTRAKRSKT